MLSTYFVGVDIIQGNASTLTYLDFGVGLTDIATSAASYFTGVQIPVVGEFVALYGIRKDHLGCIFLLGI